MLLVLVLDVPEDLDRLVDRRRIDHDLLEPAVERAVLLDVLAVFVERRRADALQLAARERRLEHVRGVERARGAARADDRVQLVDEEDDVLGLLELVHHGLHALLELAAVLRAGDKGRQIERHDALAVQDAGDLLLDDPHRQSFGDGGLAHARLADQHGIVLLPAAQDLGDALDLLFAADDRVEFVLRGELRQIVAEVVQHRASSTSPPSFPPRGLCVGRRSRACR